MNAEVPASALCSCGSFFYWYINSDHVLRSAQVPFLTCPALVHFAVSITIDWAATQQLDSGDWLIAFQQNLLRLMVTLY